MRPGRRTLLHVRLSVGLDRILGLKRVGQSNQVALRQWLATSIQPLDAVDKLPDQSSVTVRVRLEHLMARRRLIHDQRFQVVVWVPNRKEGRAQLEWREVAEGMKLATGEVQVDVLSEGNLTRPILAVDIQQFAPTKELMCLRHELHLPAIFDDCSKVKIRDPIPLALRERADQCNCKALRGSLTKRSDLGDPSEVGRGRALRSQARVEA